LCLSGTQREKPSRQEEFIILLWIISSETFHRRVPNQKTTLYQQSPEEIELSNYSILNAYKRMNA